MWAVQFFEKITNFIQLNIINNYLIFFNEKRLTNNIFYSHVLTIFALFKILYMYNNTSSVTPFNKISTKYFYCSNIKHETHSWKFIYNVNRKLKPVFISATSINDSEQKDITNLIKEYLGPNEDFFNQEITPKILGYYSIEFEYTDENFDIVKKLFNENDIIKIR